MALMGRTENASFGGKGLGQKRKDTRRNTNKKKRER